MSERYLREALRLAAKGRFTTSPNPRVGCVVVNADGRIVGRGFHVRPGEPHAEVHALRDAGEAASGATLYVNLEPCSHQGRTPPCADALISHGVSRVVACHCDPHAKVAGRGFETLRRAGVEVEVGTLASEALALNLPFVTTHLLARPSVTLKWAMSADGKIATSQGESQWISSAQGRRWALELREEHDAILVGSGTAVDDDPSLNRRMGKADGEILRVVLDRRLRLEPDARMLSLPGEVIVYTESKNQGQFARLRGAGAIVESLSSVEPGLVLKDLAQRGVQSVLVEGGGEVLSSFVLDGLFDRVEICCAPILIGGTGSPGPLGGRGVGTLAESPRLDRRWVRRRGPDLILGGYREGCLALLEERLAA